MVKKRKKKYKPRPIRPMYVTRKPRPIRRKK